MIGLPTGFKNLDTLTGGLQGTDVVILAAPPFVDEASLSLSIALNIGTLFQSGIGLFSLEMNKYQVVQRLLAMSAGIDLYRLRTGQFNEEESKQLSMAGKTLAKAHFWIDDRIGPSMVQLQQRVRQLVEIHGVSLIMVDNMHLIHMNKANTSSAYQASERSDFGRHFKTLARELHISIVVGAPMPHGRKYRLPKSVQNSDSRYRSPENGAEHLLCLYRDTPSQLLLTDNNKLAITIGIAKQRNGLITEIETALLSNRSHSHHLEQAKTLSHAENSISTDPHCEKDGLGA